MGRVFVAVLDTKHPNNHPLSKSWCVPLNKILAVSKAENVDVSVCGDREGGPRWKLEGVRVCRVFKVMFLPGAEREVALEDGGLRCLSALQSQVFVPMCTFNSFVKMKLFCYCGKKSTRQEAFSVIFFFSFFLRDRISLC